MTYFLIAVLIVLMIMVVVSLVRGVVAFMKSTKMDLERGDSEGEGATEMQLKQNSMMFARIKYQALAIVVVALIILASR